MSVLSVIMGVETSGGKNIPQGNIGDANNASGVIARGYYQIIPPTYAAAGGIPVVAPTGGYTDSFTQQTNIAMNVPIGQFGPNTQSALAAAGYGSYGASDPTTVGQVMAANGETANGLAAADGSVYGSSVTPVIPSWNDTTLGATSDSLSQFGSGVSAADLQGYPAAGIGDSYLTYPGSTSLAGVSDGPSEADGIGATVGDGSGDSLTANSAGDVYSGDYTSQYPNPNTAFQGSGASSTSSQGGGYGNSGNDPAANQSGPPVEQVGPEIPAAGNSIQSGLNSASNAVTSSTTSAINAGTGWLGSIFSASTNIFVRAGFVLLGIVVLLGAFLFFYIESGGKASDLIPKAVPIPI